MGPEKCSSKGCFLLERLCSSIFLYCPEYLICGFVKMDDELEKDVGFSFIVFDIADVI